MIKIKPSQSLDAKVTAAFLNNVALNRRGGLRSYLPTYLQIWNNEVKAYIHAHNAGISLNLALLTSHSVVHSKSLENLYTSAKANDNNERTYIAKYRNKHKGKPCPYCAGSSCGTLDHYYPKSIIPQFSIIPCNLVPCCHRCNTIKQTITPTSSHQRFIHPFFDSFDIRREIFEILPTIKSGVLVFEISANKNLSSSEVNTIDFHIKNLELNIYLQSDIRAKIRRIFDEIQTSIQAGMPAANISIKLDLMIKLHKQRNENEHWALVLLQSIRNNYQQYVQCERLIK